MKRSSPFASSWRGLALALAALAVPAAAPRALAGASHSTKPSQAIMKINAETALHLEDSDRARVLRDAETYLKEEPVTVTAFPCPRSAGGLHDFFSEGDYWWPNPNDPDGPYVQRDGMTNPDNFVKHREALIHMSMAVATLTAAYEITHDSRFARQAEKNLRAWFVDPATRMNPNLQYAQAIKGVTTGRGTGIIDTIHLVEVARSVSVLEQAGALTGTDLTAIKQWFADYLHWMTTSKNGLQERKAANNHGTCWVMQAAEFATLTGNETEREQCRIRFKTVLLPDQMAEDGSFPREIKRTKPYCYSLFNLDAMTTICWILSTPEDNLWDYATPDGRSMAKGVAFMYPYIQDKSQWPHPPDVMYWDYWPVRSPALLFAGLACGEPRWIALWKTLNPDPTNAEVLRNLPIRTPLLWVK